MKRMCQVLNVKRSGYYAWCKRPTSKGEQANWNLLEQIRTVYLMSRRTYGSPRIYAFLRHRGIVCGRNRIARLMQLNRIVARRSRRRFPITTQRRSGSRPAANLLNQNFTATRPDQKWVTDITYIDTSEGWLYLAAILDLYSRRVVGWAMADQIDTSLVEKALHMALFTRQPSPGLLHHSDQGSQYTSQEYQSYLEKQKFQVSMSRTGNCYDNAVMESFFSTLKFECAELKFTTRSQARTTIFEFIEGWYNRNRLHSSLDYHSPVEHELQFGH